MTERQFLHRDVENFIAYFKLVLSVSHLPKKIYFEPKVVKAFVLRTYTGESDSAQEAYVARLHQYLAGKIGHKIELNTENLDRLEASFQEERKPTLVNIAERVHMATILKWLQGPLWDRISRELQDYIVAVATAYGQSQEIPTPHAELQPHDLSEKDNVLIKNEYRNLEKILRESLAAVKDARAGSIHLTDNQKQLQLIVSSLDKLAKLREGNRLDSEEAFRHKILVSTALIYVQDEFVKKDPELQKNIKLLIQLYYQFRDTRW